MLNYPFPDTHGKTEGRTTRDERYVARDRHGRMVDGRETATRSASSKKAATVTVVVRGGSAEIVQRTKAK